MSRDPQRQQAKDLRFLLPALTTWVIAAGGIWLRPGWAGVVVLTLCGLGALAVLWMRGSHLLGQGVLIAALGAIMLSSVALGAAHREHDVIASAEASEAELTVSLRETFTPGMSRTSVALREVDGERVPGAGVPAVLVGLELDTRQPYGSTLHITGFLQRAESWEYEAWIILIRGEPESLQPPSWFLLQAEGLRAELLDRAEGLDGDGGRLLPGLAIGDTSAVDQGLVQAMRDTSLSHLVAVSGANCAIVVGIVVAIIGLCRGGVWAKLVGGSGALGGFVVLVTPEPSIVRASIMAVIVLVFLALKKPLKGIPVLAVTVCVILAVNPWMALDIAFVLSVLASGGILLLVGPLSDGLAQVMPRWLAVVVAIPVAAQVACQPVLILLNPVVPVWSVVANALAAPVAPVATILGMLVCVVGPLIPVVADGLAWLAWWPSAFIAFLGRLFASLPLVTVPFVPGFWGVVAMAVLAWGMVAWLLLRHPDHRWWRGVSGALAVGSLTLVTLGYQVPEILLASRIPSDWVIAQCDVGQGDALVLRIESRTILIDTGKYPAELDSCLRTLRISSLDLAIISHFDADHVGAWPVIADRVAQVWTGPVLDRKDQDITAALESAGAVVTEVGAGDQLSLGDYRLRVVWPVSPVFADPGNDSSVVVVLEGEPDCLACLSAVFLGDLGEGAQRILQGRENFGSFDVVKVSHHGSRDQFEGLYRALGADIGLIGVGAENSYGHPTALARDILEASGTMALRSDQRGIITLTPTSEGQILVWSER